MNDEVSEMKIMTLEEQYKIIDKKLDTLPDEIINKMSEATNLKIENAIQKVKIDFYKWLVPMILSILGTLIATIFSYIKQ